MTVERETGCPSGWCRQRGQAKRWAAFFLWVLDSAAEMVALEGPKVVVLSGGGGWNEAWWWWWIMAALSGYYTPLRENRGAQPRI